ncbi:MAG: hypothetical protein MN733_02810 [Nitrososphaera sp.]|nr:hypothetical protein [Nitrososphaera sp.]
MSKEQLYKVTDENGLPIHGGRGAWSLPNGAPGDWRIVEGEIVPCANGLHLCRISDLLEWLGPVIWEAEYEGEIHHYYNNVVVRKARLVRQCDAWDDRTARLFAADCAEHVKHIANDPRCDAAILAARKHAFGLIDDAALAVALTAAREAARTAVWAALRAARAAEWTVVSAIASATVREAASAALWAVEWAAGSDADAEKPEARDTERKWQSERLHKYLTGKVDLDAIKRKVD